MYKSMCEALSAYNVTESVVPTKYPSGFQICDIKTTTLTDSVKIQAKYEFGDKFFSITLWQFASEEVANRSFEKDTSSVTIYEYYNTNHYLMSNNGQMRAAWAVKSLVCTISGDLIEDEIKHMINSIYEG